MKPVFSNISYFLRTKSTFFTYPTNLFGEVLRPLKNLKILIAKFYHYCLKFCEMMPRKSSFQTVSMIKGLVLW